jgi:hypothetical protein
VSAVMTAAKHADDAAEGFAVCGFAL